MEPDDCLDKRNHDFYYMEIANNLNVNLILGNTGNKVWTVQYRDGDENVSVFAGIDYPNIESFSHEILHLYLFINGFKTFYIEYVIMFSNLFKTLIKPFETLNEISNTISHFKMYPLFTEKLKMDGSKFLSNINNYMSDDHLKDLLKNKKGNSQDLQYYFTNFIRHYFDVRYDFPFILSEKNKYFLTQLKNIDEKLFTILEECCIAWEADICNYDNEEFFCTLIFKLDQYLKT